MFLTDLGMPAYTTREFRNFGLHKAGSLYQYQFTQSENLLIYSGAIKLFPYQMYKFYTTNETNLNGKKVKKGTVINYKDFDENTLKVLVKTNILKCTICDDLKDKNEKELISIAKLYNCVGLTFKKVSNTFGLDFDKVKEVFELKQGANTKKVKTSDIEKLQELLKQSLEV